MSLLQIDPRSAGSFQRHPGFAETQLLAQTADQAEKSFACMVQIMDQAQQQEFRKQAEQAEALRQQLQQLGCGVCGMLRAAAADSAEPNLGE